VRGWISRQHSLSACLVAAGFLMPTSGIAQNGVVRFLCEDSWSSARWSFSVDFDNQLIRAEVPINWTLITSTEVLFGHTAIAGGHYYLTQSYTLNRQTGAFEMCDYVGDSERRSPCSSQYVCRATSLTFDNAF
jgi:hypothetical protein